MRRFFPADQFDKRVRKSKYRGSILAVTRHSRTAYQSVISTENHGIGINQKEPFIVVV